LKDIGEHNNLGTSVVGNLKKKPKRKRLTKKKLEAGAVNGAIRTTKLEYLQHCTKTVGVTNNRGEYELKPSRQCEEGDVVWVMEEDGTFTETKIY
tara:strand:- start:430 stop:714 length:285 start_codon:yes stop_codon:yes gene_type:complete